MTDIDSRGPQDKGKPSFAVANSQAGVSDSVGQPAEIPNRSGAVLNNMTDAKDSTASGGGKHSRDKSAESPF